MRCRIIRFGGDTRRQDPCVRKHFFGWHRRWHQYWPRSVPSAPHVGKFTNPHRGERMALRSGIDLRHAGLCCVCGQQKHRLANTNAMLHFDPKTEKFTAYKSSSHSASVRQILGRPGEVWLPESKADKLVVIRK